MTDDRRSKRRAPAIIEVSWEEASGRHEARTSDISATGCFIITIFRATLGEIINFKVHLPDQDPIETQGEVVYELPNSGFGVRFIPSLSELDWIRVERAINS